MTSFIRLGRRAFLATGSAFLSACSPLGLIDALTPADAGGRLAASGIAYGPDERHRLDIYVPERGAGQAPVMVFLYGGGWNSGERADYGFVGRAFAALGFVTVIPDYRLVPQVRFPAFVEDGALALRWVRDQIASYGGNASGIALSGHSAGAYNAMMLVLDRRFLARVGLRPGFIRGVAGLAGPYDFLPLDDPRSIAAFGEFPRLTETQPVAFASALAPRVFLATGDEDETVRPRNSVSLAQKLRTAGATVELRTYPGLGHAGILLALNAGFRDRAPVLADMVRFARAQAPLATTP
ncbi:Alpha/beta hydrolase [Bosea sp. 62]|uniref:alpha/beta hydrolase n=1 Tax=unclassified Bosea (in: a-proteobacteria) TaxID=2653178 RepID=UPI00125BEDF5|nr:MULTISPECIES: alpha/beta hydrolase [unclassified Bosea (in: a-proteobacteria)]CAD5251144.1 Alpha/beta hydrolase [Bosea sp. 21B]CAD5262449.1 Alpha/beta hydrolase [Bosea sp. 7B]CAD5272208.1 Alpha/beta hydrolase [Bosea sp. 46]VVT43699.1 Alpha/beta hydrolase [Bosea sp. EC-HK365B]VXB21468.1 Alpha/beta hydrolase [Bosea sp. 29B]